jgi:hypothetical protein
MKKAIISLSVVLVSLNVFGQEGKGYMGYKEVLDSVSQRVNDSTVWNNKGFEVFRNGVGVKYYTAYTKDKSLNDQGIYQDTIKSEFKINADREGTLSYPYSKGGKMVELSTYFSYRKIEEKDYLVVLKGGAFYFLYPNVELKLPVVKDGFENGIGEYHVGGEVSATSLSEEIKKSSNTVYKSFNTEVSVEEGKLTLSMIRGKITYLELRTSRVTAMQYYAKFNKEFGIKGTEGNNEFTWEMGFKMVKVIKVGEDEFKVIMVDNVFSEAIKTHYSVLKPKGMFDK